jgi:hypothetical protein
MPSCGPATGLLLNCKNSEHHEECHTYASFYFKYHKLPSKNFSMQGRKKTADRFLCGKAVVTYLCLSCLSAPVFISLLSAF